MDLSKLVSGGGKLKGAYGDLAYKIGTFCPSIEPRYESVWRSCAEDHVSIEECHSQRSGLQHMPGGSAVHGVSSELYFVSMKRLAKVQSVLQA